MWTATTSKLPEEGQWVNTIIIDEDGARNEQTMKYENNLWWISDDMYCYYSPTHWQYIQ